MEFEDVVVSYARFLHSALDELVVLLVIDAAVRMVPAHAVHDALEIVRLPRQTFESRRKRLGAPRLGLVPVIDSGVHCPGNQLLRPGRRAHEAADLKPGAAVSPLGQFVGGGLLIRHHRQVGDACRGHTRRPEPHHVPARKVLRVIRHSHNPLLLLLRHGNRPGSVQVQSTVQPAAVNNRVSGQGKLDILEWHKYYSVGSLARLITPRRCSTASAAFGLARRPAGSAPDATPTTAGSRRAPVSVASCAAHGQAPAAQTHKIRFAGRRSGISPL